MLLALKRLEIILLALWRFLKRASKAVWSLPWWADVLTIMTAAAALYEILYATVPVIQPDEAISSSWADLPITATDTSEIFGLHDAAFRCAVTDLTFQGIDGSPIPLHTSTVHTVPGSPVTIEPRQTITFPCDFSKNTLVWESVPGQTAKKRLPVAWANVRIKTAYSVKIGPFVWHRHTTSQQFTWRAVSGGYQWLEGYKTDSTKQ